MQGEDRAAQQPHPALLRFLDSSSDGIRVIDLRDAIVYENAALGRILGDASDATLLLDALADVLRAAQHDAARGDFSASAGRHLDVGGGRYAIRAVGMPPGVLTAGPVVVASLTPEGPADVTLETIVRARGLTPRQVEVLHGLAKGWSNRHVAEALGLSVHTVRRHVERIFGKLGLHSRVQVAAWVARSIPKSGPMVGPRL